MSVDSPPVQSRGWARGWARGWGRSAGAVLAGLVATVALSIGTDMALMAAGIFPDFAAPQSFTTPMLIAATLYRTAYGVIGSMIAAQLAPRRPMLHAMVLGALGFAASVTGAVTMWNFGPNWYPLALVALALPGAWIGGLIQGQRSSR